MIAAEFISIDIIPLKKSDTGRAALLAMGDYYVKHLPLVQDGELIGVISEQDVLDNPLDDEIGSYELFLDKPKVNHSDHLFDVMRVMAEHSLTSIPVLDQQGDFLGIITQEGLIQYYANSFSFSQPGGILVLELAKTNYSLSEISRLVESENGQVLTSFITAKPESDNVLVTLKINKSDLNTIQATFERFGYSISAVYAEAEYLDVLKERYDSLIHYLNV